MNDKEYLEARENTELTENIKRWHSLLPYMTSMTAYISQFGLMLNVSYWYDEKAPAIEFDVRFDSLAPGACRAKIVRRYTIDSHIEITHEMFLLKLTVIGAFQDLLNQLLKPLQEFTYGVTKNG